MRLNILIRLPNWLGDMVMATPLLQALSVIYPNATVDVIVKKGLDSLTAYLPGINNRYIFSKDSHKGLRGAWRFGKAIAAKQQYDLFICLPNSFSAAVMARATGASNRLGYRKELRSWLLTHACSIPSGKHRVDTYLYLLQQYASINITAPPAAFKVPPQERSQHIIVNLNSEAQSRRLPVHKAISLLTALRKAVTLPITLIGSPAEQAFVTTVYEALPDKTGIHNMAGQTTLSELLNLLSSAAVMLTTDSGPAHLGNALGVHTVVIFGAGNEKETAPYNSNRTIIRLGQLSCEACVSNTCRQFSEPHCLTLLNESIVIQAVTSLLKH